MCPVQLRQFWMCPSFKKMFNEAIENVVPNNIMEFVLHDDASSILTEDGIVDTQEVDKS
jgi:hypothetical protein